MNRACMRPPMSRVAVSLVALYAAPAVGQTTYHVNNQHPPGGDGLSWATAFHSLQDALAVAVSGDEILVAVGDGPYRPGTSRGSTFLIPDGVRVLGGDLVGSTFYPDAAKPILTGDLDSTYGDDIYQSDYADNAYHVVTFAENAGPTTVLRSFEITYGYADDCAGNHCSGAGILVKNSNPTITLCEISNNRAHFGGGIALLSPGQNIELTDCVFEQNFALGDAGAGIYADVATLTLRNCTIDSCLTRDDPSTVSAANGGGFCIYADSVGIEDCTFQGNVAGADLSAYGYTSGTTGFGGAGIIHADQELGEIRIVNSTFLKNAAGTSGGAIDATGHSIYLERSQFHSNTASALGGGVLLGLSSTIDVLACRFSRNAALSGLGGYFYGPVTPEGAVRISHSIATEHSNISNSGTGTAFYFWRLESVEIVNSEISFNGEPAYSLSEPFPTYQGAVYASECDDLRISSCTFANNYGASSTGLTGVALYLDDTPAVIENSIFWDNLRQLDLDEFVPDDAAISWSGTAPSVSYSDVQLSTGTFSGVGNINADPMFVLTAPLRIASNSPCVDAGNTSLLPSDALDLDSDSNWTEAIPFDIGYFWLWSPRTRVRGVAVDMGAYETGEFCQTDWNQDGSVNSADLSAFQTSWLADLDNGTTNTDFNQDGLVNSADLSAFLAAWLADIGSGGC